MELTNLQKSILRSIEILGFTRKETTIENSEFIMLSFSVLLNAAYEEILSTNVGFKQIKRIRSSAPEKANCIIRLFKKRHQTGDLVFSLYGVNCFVKNSDGKWTSNSSYRHNFEIDFSEHAVILHLYQQCIFINNTDFIDIYVKVKVS